MATMYPQHLPSSVKSAAEQRLFHALRTSLPDEYVVLWSIDWTVIRPQNRGGGTQESEVDFLILHPDKGILVLEVKGGGVGYDGQLHEWYTVNRNNERHNIKDPFEQAKDSKHTLIRELTQRVPLQWLRDSCRNSCFGHAVVVPDISKTKLANRSTRPEEFILDRRDIQPETLKPALDAVYTGWRRATTKPLGQAAVNEIIEMYAPSWYVRPLLASVFEEEQAQLKELTEQQFITLNTLSKQNRVAISGCAGSGKTFLAIEQAKRLARRGMSVLVTCYNRNLADWLRRHLAEQARTDLALRSIEVFNFHRVASHLCEAAHITLPNDQARLYDEEFAEGLLDASQVVEQRYDAIIADEGQDFNDSWWIALFSLLRSEEESFFYIFYDDNQRIYKRDSSYPIPEDHHYPLTVNCRTTVKIHNEVMLYYNAAEPPLCKGPLGRDIERVHVEAKASEEFKALAALLKRLVGEGINIEDIVLLSPVAKYRSRFREGTNIAGQFRLSWNMQGSPEPNTLTCCTIFAFKGLERDIVILAEPDKIQENTEREQLIYVALSRAKFHLILLGDVAPLLLPPST